MCATLAGRIQHQTPPRMPPQLQDEPYALIRGLASYTLDVLAGVAELENIARWLSSTAYAMLHNRATLAASARRLDSRATLKPRVVLGGIVLAKPCVGVIEAALVTHGSVRAQAIAIRLEQLGCRWQATAIQVL